ncbi:MAG: GDYXXLXY domain-containing protein, partial [Halioglobus sp.]|nr:GDYXXLXY domain-containing protein [Halioglobus sp.]
SRADDGRELAANEVRLKYKQVDSSGRIRLGAESFFFEEGQAPQFVNARYDVLHVDAAGNSVLIGLADADGRVISPD